MELKSRAELKICWRYSVVGKIKGRKNMKRENPAGAKGRAAGFLFNVHGSHVAVSAFDVIEMQSGIILRTS